MLELLHLENFSKDELCDIYWNLADGIWDRRIGRKPKDFDFLPDEPTRFKKNSKKSYLSSYIKKNRRPYNPKRTQILLDGYYYEMYSRTGI